MVPFFLLEIFVQVLWSLTPSASNLVLRYLPVESYTAIRYSISGTLFLAIALFREPGLRIRRRDLPGMIALGICTYGLASLGTLYGLKWGGVVTFALASSANAVITATASVWLLHEKWNRTLLAAIALSIGGSLLLGWGKYGLSSAHVAILSLVAIWAAYVCEALGFVFSKRYQRKYSLPCYLAVLQWSGASFMWIVSASTHHMPQSLSGLPTLFWLSLGFVSLVSCGFCFGMHYWLLRWIDGHKLAFFDCAHSLSAAAFGVLFFAEKFNAAMLAGGALLVASVWIVTLPAAPSHPAS